MPAAGLNALTRVPLGVWREEPDLVALYEASLRETVAVGLAEGVRLPPDSFDNGMAQMRSMPAHHMTSMGNDLLRGNRLCDAPVTFIAVWRHQPIGGDVDPRDLIVYSGTGSPASFKRAAL